MKVIPPSFDILDDLDRQGLLVRIEACGRVCYKSEDRISESSAEPFVRNIIRHGHNSVTEMAVLTLKVAIDKESLLDQLYRTAPKYLFIDQLGEQMLITGSVRAFREMGLFHPDVVLVRAMIGFLLERHPVLFGDVAPAGGVGDGAGIVVEKLSLDEVESLPADLLARHRHLAVKFYVNRAITHEIVRHRPCSYLQESQRYCRYSESKFDSQVTFIRPMFFAEGSEEYRLWEEAMRETERIYIKLLETSSPQAARTVLPNSCKTELIAYANLTEWKHILNLRTSPGAEPSMREVMIPLLMEFKQRYPEVFADIRIKAEVV